MSEATVSINPLAVDNASSYAWLMMVTGAGDLVLSNGVSKVMFSLKNLIGRRCDRRRHLTKICFLFDRFHFRLRPLNKNFGSIYAIGQSGRNILHRMHNGNLICNRLVFWRIDTFCSMRKSGAIFYWICSNLIWNHSKF